MILALGLVTSQFAFADGRDSPAECLGGLKDDTGGPTTIDVGEGNTITGICIKSGNEAFEEWKHSGLITEDGIVGDGYISNNCYEVSGFLVGGQVVTITETGNVDCKAISHVDYIIGDLVGGHGGITDNTALLVAGATLTASWMIPLIVSAIGIGVFVVTRK